MLLGLALIFILALLLRLRGLDRSLWIDEAGSIHQARATSFLAAARHDVHPPLYYAILRLGFRLTDSIALLRGFSVVCGLWLVAFGAMLAAPSRMGMILGAAIFALLPGFIYHSQELRPYALLYLAFAAALFLAVRKAEGRSVAGGDAMLAAVLLAAAATHQLTAFFLVSLVPFLIWPARRSGGFLILKRLLPLVPAAALVVGFNLVFLQRPDQQVGGWWVPPASWGYTREIAREAAGWTDVLRLGDAIGRHLPHGEYFPSIALPLAGLTALGILLAAWCHRQADPITLLLLLTSAIYVCALLLYSHLREPLLLTRTLLPGLLPLSVAVARGLAGQPRRWLRWSGAVGLSLYLAAASASFGLQAKLPREDLRGLATTARDRHRTGDLIILFRSMDYALRPYWTELATTDPLLIDQTSPSTPALAALRARLDDRARQPRRVQILYRADFYFDAQHGVFPAVMAELNSRRFISTEIWQKDGYVFLEANAP